MGLIISRPVPLFFFDTVLIRMEQVQNYFKRTCLSFYLPKTNYSSKYIKIMRKSPMIIGVCILLCQLSCNSKKHEKPEETKYLVTSPIKKDTAAVKDYVCQIHSIRNIEVRALEKGYLKEISVDEGQSVKKGQQMFHIMPNVYEAEFQKATAEARVAEIEYENTK